MYLEKSKNMRAMMLSAEETIQLNHIILLKESRLTILSRKGLVWWIDMLRLASISKCETDSIMSTNLPPWSPIVTLSVKSSFVCSEMKKQQGRIGKSTRVVLLDSVLTSTDPDTSLRNPKTTLSRDQSFLGKNRLKRVAKTPGWVS